MSAVIEHGAVDDTFRLFGKMLEVGIVGSDDTEGLLLIEAGKDRFGDSAADEGFRAGTEFIDEQEGVTVRLANERLHIAQVGGVGRKVVGDGLFVSDVDHQAAEDTHATVFVKGHEQSALQHVLQQGNGLG